MTTSEAMARKQLSHEEILEGLEQEDSDNDPFISDTATESDTEEDGGWNSTYTGD